MLFIVFSHYSYYCNFGFSVNDISLNRIYTQSTVLGPLGVNLFVLISGYFMSSSQSGINFKKIAKLWGKLFFYSFGIYLIFLFAGKASFDTMSVIKNMLPIIYEQWWFASTYVVLMVLSPYINIMLNHLSEKQHKNLLLILMFCWVIIPTLAERNMQSNSLLWFIYLYSFAAYCRKYIHNFKKSKKYYLCIALSFLALYVLSVISFDFLGQKYEYFASRTLYFINNQRVVFFFGVCCSFYRFH